MDEDDEGDQEGPRWEYTEVGLENGWAGVQGGSSSQAFGCELMSCSFPSGYIKAFPTDGGWQLGGRLLKSMQIRKQKAKAKGKQKQRISLPTIE